MGKTSVKFWVRDFSWNLSSQFFFGRTKSTGAVYVHLWLLWLSSSPLFSSLLSLLAFSRSACLHLLPVYQHSRECCGSLTRLSPQSEKERMRWRPHPSILLSDSLPVCPSVRPSSVLWFNINKRLSDFHEIW